MSSAQTEVRSALAAYIEGATPLPVFEQSVARLLAGRGSVRGIVHSELKAAVADGTLPPESLRRLGLVDAAATFVEHPEPEVRQRDNRPRLRHAVRSRDAGGNQDPGARPAGRSRARKPPTPFESADTGSGWSDNRPAPPPIPECGGVLGNRYRLERVLGEGGMGVVFLAIDQEVRGEMFAVKVLRPEIRANPESLRLLREEVRRTRALRHPHIVGVYSLNSDPSGVYMLMEYLEGKSLKTVLDEEFGRGMPLIRAWPMIYDVGAALAYAHDHNVIHSDIKPSNVIITSSGSCKLLDFGIARADRNRTTTRDATVIGALTPAYACCEMFEGRAPDQSDDVYAFACVIYEMLTGRHPYGRMNAVDARARKLQPAPIKALTNRQNHALARALEFDRERRTASVEILLEGLKGMANNGRDRTAWLTTAAAFAAVVAVSSGWYWEHRTSQQFAAHKEPAADSIAPPVLAPPVLARAVPPEPSPAGPPVLSRPDRGQQGTRPEPGSAAPSSGSSTAKGRPAAPVAAASAATTAATQAAAPTPMATGSAKPPEPSKTAAAPTVAATPMATGSAKPPEPSKITAAPTVAATPPATGSAKPPEPDKTAAAPTVAATPPATASAATSEPAIETAAPAVATSALVATATGGAVLSELDKTISAAPVAPPLATPASTGGSSALLEPSKTAAAPPARPPASDDAVLESPPRTIAKTTVAAAIPASSVATDLGNSTPITDSHPLPILDAATKKEIERPPVGKKVPAVVATPDSQVKMQSEESCRYPAEARKELQTGTVVMLVYVTPDGSTASAQLDGDGSSGSSVLDQAALRCVRDVGRFPVKLVGSKPAGYWARTRFVWSFGD